MSSSLGAIYVAGLASHATLVFAIVGNNATSWITFAGLAVIDTLICVAAARECRP